MLECSDPLLALAAPSLDVGLSKGFGPAACVVLQQCRGAAHAVTPLRRQQQEAGQRVSANRSALSADAKARKYNGNQRYAAAHAAHSAL